MQGKWDNGIGASATTGELSHAKNPTKLTLQATVNLMNYAMHI